MLASDFLAETVPFLEQALPGRVKRSAPLAEVARWQIGGLATVLIDCASANDVAVVRRAMAGRSEPIFVMGDGSNMLFDDRGFRGIILRIARHMSRIEVAGDIVFAEAGTWVPSLARAAANAHLSGLEHAAGIPGTFGGLIVMNGGSQRKGVGLNVENVVVIDMAGNELALSNAECAFSYRTSALQNGTLIVVGATLRLVPGSKSDIKRDMIEILRSRKQRFPKNLPNGGSTFLSSPLLYEQAGPPGRIIEDLGLKGFSCGRARVSPMHANFIVNEGGASSSDVLSLIHKIRKAALEKTGVLMDCEVRHLSPDGLVRPAHVAADELYGQL